MSIQMPGAMTPVTDTKDATDSARQLQREKDLEKACQGFEALMLDTLMKRMRDTLPATVFSPKAMRLISTSLCMTSI